MRRILTLAGMLLSIAYGTATAASLETGVGGLPPWNFYMSPQQVMSFADYGPYRSFSNGDLETFTGMFDGNKQNVQFFFKDGKLTRIGIYLYEGQDIKEAAAVWGQTYRTLKAKFGDIELPDIKPPVAGTPVELEVMATAAGANVDARGKSQMAPLRQPADKFVFASFRRSDVRGQMFYYVTVYYDPPRG